jgi:hypothetical protein
VIRLTATVLLLVGFVHLLPAQNFNFNENCRNAYNSIIALKLDEGNALLKAEQKKNPDNLIPIYLENYVDFLRAYTSETSDDFNALKKNKELRLVQLTEGDPASPYYLFTQAEVNAQCASAALKFGEYINAVFEIRKALKLLEENRKKFPAFAANKKSLGVLYALLGTVPDKYKWGLNLLGLEGNLQKGLSYLHELNEYGQNNDFIYTEETATIYAFLLLHLQNDGAAAWHVLQQNHFPAKENLMHTYTCAHIGIYSKHTDEALQILNNRPISGFAFFPLLDYLSGLARLNNLDTSAASYFKKFIAANKGENHVKSAFQKIAWCALLKADTANYLHFINKALRFGNATLDADKQVVKEAESKHIPNVHLLKARLLFDGGYYPAATSQMNQMPESTFINAEEHTEYVYRNARIYDEWEKKDTALVLYAKTIELGKNLPRYFAANAALSSAKIYEARNDKEKAAYFYHLCLGFENHEYKNSLDQKAKAGISRLNKQN